MSFFDNALLYYLESGLSQESAETEAYWLELEYFDIVDSIYQGYSEEEYHQLQEELLNSEVIEKNYEEVYCQAA